MNHRKSGWRWWRFAGVACATLVLLSAGVYWKIARPFLHMDPIERQAKAYGFDPLFILALVRAESSFSRQARSARGAVGLMQIMPDTAREMAERLGMDPAGLDLEDPDVNILLGVKYLDVLRTEFGSDRVRILAAYNAGPTNARSWSPEKILVPEDIPFLETRRFVERVLGAEQWLQRARGLKRRLRD